MARQNMDFRKATIAATLIRARRNPIASIIHEFDITEIVSCLSRINNSVSSEITLNSLLMYIIVIGIKSCPAVNARIHYKKWFATGYITLIEKIDINMPVILPTGETFEIKLPDCGNKNLLEMQECISRLTEKLNNTDLDSVFVQIGIREAFRLIKNGAVIHPFLLLRLLGMKLFKNGKKIDLAAEKKEKINIEDIDMGTVLVTNTGAGDKKGFPTLLTIPAPQVFGVGIGSIYDDAVIFENPDKEKEISIRKKVRFCMTFDHRALDFSDILPFVKKIDEVCGNPQLYLLNDIDKTAPKTI